MTTWRHKKRGTLYREIGRGFASIADMPIQDYTAVVIYQGMDGTLWVRNAVEFDDGRFEQITPVADEQSAPCNMQGIDPTTFPFDEAEQ